MITALVSGEAFCSGIVLASPPLVGHMARLGYLVGGTWTCIAKMPAMNDQRARTGTGSAVFEVVAGNVLHARASGGGFAGDQYYGYDGKTQRWWAAGADNQGQTSFETSTDARRYTGAAGGSSPAFISDTYTRITANRLHIHEVNGSGPSASYFDSHCAR